MIYKKLFKNLIFPVMELQQGTTIHRDLKWLNKTQWCSRKKIEELQNKKLRALIKHAYSNVPYYHKIFKDSNLKPYDIKTKEDLNKLPLLKKETIRNNLEDMLAQNIPKSNFIESHSSGSTGEPLKYYVDKNSYSHGWAQTFRCWGWAGYELGDHYIKMGIVPRSTVTKKVQDILMNCTYLYCLDVTETILERQIEIIKNSNAKIVRGYASSMYLLAKYLEDNSNPKIKLNAIMTTGDTLFPHYRELIEEYFCCKVFDAYGGESTAVAFECEKHEGYHLSEENVVVEFLRDHEYVSSGELGEIVFTNLNNFAMPLIRYMIGDMGTPSDEFCTCGRKLGLMKSVAGRSMDVVTTPKGNLLVAHFFTSLFRFIAGVKQFQVLQESIDKLIIRIIRTDDFNEDDLHHIKSKIHEHAGRAMSIEIEFVESIPLTSSGKRRFVISNITPDFIGGIYEKESS